MAFNGNKMCTSFKRELLEGVHNFKVSGGGAFHLALYTNSAAGTNFGGSSSDMDETITNYATNNEVTGTGYVAKGQPLTRIDPAIGGTTAYTTFDNTSSIWQSSTITARGAIIFNDTPTSPQADPAVIVLDFVSDKSSSSGDFKVVFPTAAAGSAIIRIA